MIPLVTELEIPFPNEFHWNVQWYWILFVHIVRNPFYWWLFSDMIWVLNQIRNSFIWWTNVQNLSMWPFVLLYYCNIEPCHCLHIDTLTSGIFLWFGSREDNCVLYLLIQQELFFKLISVQLFWVLPLITTLSVIIETVLIEQIDYFIFST